MPRPEGRAGTCPIRDLAVAEARLSDGHRLAVQLIESIDRQAFSNMHQVERITRVAVRESALEQWATAAKAPLWAVQAAASWLHAHAALAGIRSSLMVGDQLGVGHDPGQHAAYVKRWARVLKEDPKEILRASRDADKITGYVLGLEKERLPTNMEKLPQVEGLAPPEKVERQPAPQRVRVAGGRDR